MKKSSSSFLQFPARSYRAYRGRGEWIHALNHARGVIHLIFRFRGTMDNDNWWVLWGFSLTKSNCHETTS